MAIRPENDTHLFRTPVDLRVTDRKPLNLLFVGSCLVSGILDFFKSIAPCSGDYILFNNVGNLPPAPPQPIAAYDLQIVQVPLRSVLPDGIFESLPYGDPAAHVRLFAEAESRLQQLLDAALGWNEAHGMPTLVVNFFQPQQNPTGRLLPWHDLRNIAYFVARLNETVEREALRRRNCHVLNFDEIAATFGRKFIQDDVLWQFNHAAALNDNDFEPDQRRLHPPEPASRHYTLRIPDFLHAVYNEIEAIHATIHGLDAVKLVIVDLDDTLWRGVIVEDGSVTSETLEGWPLGLAEALRMLKNRGIMLAIVSKNDEARIRALWGSVFGQRLLLDDFAAVRINWQPKADNIDEVIRAINVLPTSVVFIDDNPVERAQVEDAIPGIRTLGADLYYLRRVLLWAPEAQVPFVTDESGRRTDMVRAQLDRETQRKRMSREEFIASLSIVLTMAPLSGADDPRFNRTLELVNKTNQFNTTGRRWTQEAFVAALAAGTRVHAFEVRDKFTDYGLVGVVLVTGSTIEQFLMSCRVVGLDVETQILGRLVDELQAAGAGAVTGIYQPTGKNELCAELFERAGFTAASDGRWIKNRDASPAA